LGLFAMTQPAEFGGSEAGPLALVVAREAVAAGNLRLARHVFGPGPGVLRSAEGTTRSKFLEPLLSGEAQGAFAFTEPGDALRPTWAVRDGDDLLVTGRKAYVSGGATANFYSAFVTVEDGPAGDGGGTAMLVIEAGTPGVTIDRSFVSMDGGGHVSLTLDGARVPVANVIGAIGEGLPRALGNITDMRLLVAAEATGLAIWTTNFVTEHLRAPHRSGTPLGEHEGVRLRYGEMRIETYAARSMLYRSARLRESGDDAINEIAATKLFAAEAVGRVVDTAIQLVGGQALIVGHPLEQLYRRVRALRLGEGASDLLRINVARGILEFKVGRL
ncbi:MAG: acyl-CoA dehydrogenase family protein, partial [Chloroflexi bacterium]|nr:acyl-CoA dehydrogenase family protein [Chloroflexota bacterium]